jgi:roadblock/LC7 domain-containing protein
MPHAGGPSTTQNNETSQGQQQQTGGFAEGISSQAGKLADYARENPKTAAAAGAAIVGAIAAAAIPLVRARTGGTTETAQKSGTNSKKNKQEA